MSMNSAQLRTKVESVFETLFLNRKRMLENIQKANNCRWHYVTDLIFVLRQNQPNFVRKWGQKIWEGLLVNNSTVFFFFFTYCGLGCPVPADSKLISEIFFSQLRSSVIQWSDRLRTKVRFRSTEFPLLHRVHTDSVAHHNLRSYGYRGFFP